MIPKVETYNSLDEIVDGCICGNRTAQRTLYERYARSMTTLCMRYLGDKQTAMDIMHDAFIHLFSSIDKFEGKGSFEGWLKRIFITQSLQHLRKNDLLRHSGNIEDVRDIVSTETTDALDMLSAEEIMNEITKLQPLNRSVFNLYALEGYSHKEIANQLNINESTVRSIYLRTRQALQKRLIDHR